MTTGIQRLTLDSTVNFVHYMHRVMPREEQMTSIQKALSYREDVFDFLVQWTRDPCCNPIPNKLKHLFVDLAIDMFMSPEATDEDCRGQAEFMLNEIDKVQRRQIEHEKKLWSQFRDHRSKIRRTNCKGMTLDVANILAAHGSGTSERKEFERYAAAHSRVYQTF